jgi:hypothetical protein
MIGAQEPVLAVKSRFGAPCVRTEMAVSVPGALKVMSTGVQLTLLPMLAGEKMVCAAALRGIEPTRTKARNVRIAAKEDRPIPAPDFEKKI